MEAAHKRITDGMVTGNMVAQWVGAVLGHNFDLSVAQGIGWIRGGNIVAGAAFTDYNKAMINMHIAVTKGERMPPTFVAAIMDYPFVQLGVKRINGLIDESNEQSRRFAEHLGAVQECVLQDALPNGNLVVYGLLKKHAQKWLTASYSRRLRTEATDGRTV